ncbi:MAG: hypothetical protein KQH63_05865 [Desulfobulbaceae bacterium]|nr:hypothetical protein [Desulfobulbaceae bacterium]
MVRYALILMTLLFSFACAPTDPGSDAMHKEGYPVDFLDNKIVKNLKLLDHHAERLPSGHVDVMLRCISREEKKPIWIDWKVTFFDSRNIAVEESEWHTEHLSPQTVKTLQVGSIRRDINTFRFLIRTPAK